MILSQSYTILFVSLSHLVFGKLDLKLITGGVFLLSFFQYLNFHLKTGTLDPKSKHMSVYMQIALFIVLGVFTYAMLFNTIRFLPYDKSIALIGTNDDNANHMAYAAISLKEGSLMFKSETIKHMSNDSISTVATGWYPYGLYSNVNVWYASIRDFFGWQKPLELASFFSLNAIYHPLAFVSLMVLVFYVSDRLYKIKSIYSMPLLISIGILVVSNQFFVKLLVYGFHSQLMAYGQLMALIVLVHENRHKSCNDIKHFLNISLLVFAIGVTYYYFIPLTLLSLVFTQKRNAPFPLFGFPYTAWLLGLIPLFYFSTYLSISTQFQSYGVAFIPFVGLILCLISVLISFFVKQLDGDFRKTLFVLFAATIVQMVLSGSSFFIATNNLSYYFFKSYWTLGLFALPILLAILGILGDAFAVAGKKTAVIFMAISLILASGLFFNVFNQKGFDYNGYDLSLLIHNGSVNYFSSGIQKEWIDTYSSMSLKNQKSIGKTIYAPSLWGHWILSYALFGDLPPVFKRLSMSGTINQSKIRYQYIAEAIANDIIYGKDPIVLDTVLNLYVREKVKGLGIKKQQIQ